MNESAEQFRVWILHCEPWEPKHSTDIPPRAIALEPAEADCFTAAEARDYVEGFNASPQRPQALWAIRVPVRARPDREFVPGTLIRVDPACGKLASRPRSTKCLR